MSSPAIDSSKKIVKFHDYSRATAIERKYCKWIVIDYARDISGNPIYKPDDQKIAQFAKQTITQNGKAGCIILFSAKDLDYPALYMLSLLEGEEPNVLIDAALFNNALFVHPKWFVHGYVVFSMESDGEPSGLLQFNPEQNKYVLIDKLSQEDAETLRLARKIANDGKSAPLSSTLRSPDQLPKQDADVYTPGTVGKLLVVRQDHIPFPLVDVQIIFQWTENGQDQFTAPYVVASKIEASAEIDVPGPDADLDFAYLFYREGSAANAPRKVLLMYNHRDWKPGDHWRQLVAGFISIATSNGTYYGTEAFVW